MRNIAVTKALKSMPNYRTNFMSRPSPVSTRAAKWLLLALLLFLCPPGHAQTLVGWNGITLSPSGRPMSASVSVCNYPGLATTAAQVIGNTAILTMASNPVTAGFAANMSLSVSGFTGGDTYFNGTFQITSVSATTITFPLVHANASASSNGNLFQTGNISTPCAPLASIFSDFFGALPITQPGLVSSGIGNVSFYVSPGNYQIQFYGAGVTTFVQPITVSFIQIGANNTFTGSNTFTQPIVGSVSLFQGATWASPLAIGTVAPNSALFSKVNNVVYIDGITNPSLDAFLASPTANTTLIVPANQTLSTRPTVSVSGLKIRCENNAVIAVNVNDGINFTGNNDGIEDCTFAGPGTGTPTVQLATSTGNGFFFRRNIVSGFGSTSGNGVIEPIQGSQGSISDNTITGNVESSVFLNAVGTTVTMNDWKVQRNTLQNIEVHATSAASNINHLVVVGNDLFTGTNGNNEFCVEIGTFGGTAVTDATVSGNHCYLTANGTDGGYSLSTISHFTLSANSFDNKGFTYTVNSYECVQCTDGSITGNQANSGTGGPGFGIDGLSASKLTITGNTQNGFLTASSGSGIYIGTSITSGAMNDIVVADNVVIFPTGGAGAGIWLQCNATSSTCNNNTIASNHIFSDGTGGSVGIKLENDTGTMIGNAVTLNTISGPASIFSLGGTVGAKIEDRNGIPFASLPAAAAGLNGSVIYSTDSTIANPCAAAGTGALAKYLNAVRVCN